MKCNYGRKFHSLETSEKRQQRNPFLPLIRFRKFLQVAHFSWVMGRIQKEVRFRKHHLPVFVIQPIRCRRPHFIIAFELAKEVGFCSAHDHNLHIWAARKLTTSVRMTYKRAARRRLFQFARTLCKRALHSFLKRDLVGEFRRFELEDRVFSWLKHGKRQSKVFSLFQIATPLRHFQHFINVYLFVQWNVMYLSKHVGLCMCMSCMCMWMCVCVCKCVCICMHACMHAYNICICMYVSM